MDAKPAVGADAGSLGGQTLMKVRFPDGTFVTACSLAERRESNPDRDFGLYMDARWRPTWDAHVIDWPDFGLPKEPLAAAQSIAAALERTKRGERLEIGCAGGLGRTGTALGCMAVLAGVPTPLAVRWVRENYHEKAIETPEQQAWIPWFAERVGGGEVRG